MSAAEIEALTAVERESLARVTGGHIKPFNHHPCITCAVQAEVGRILAERLTDMDQYVGKVPGYHADLSATASAVQEVDRG